MQNSEIFIPFFGLMMLTFFVWCYMYYLRLSWVIKNKINPDALSTPEKLNKLIPEEINYASNNLVNLFELPVLFYGVCICLVMLGLVDWFYVICAYGFFAFRVVHSLIHCTINHMHSRFITYILSSVCLWIMVIRGTISIFNIL